MQQTVQTFNLRHYNHPKDFEGVKTLMRKVTQVMGDQLDNKLFEDSIKNRLLTRIYNDSVGTFVVESNYEIIGSIFADIEQDPRGALRGRISYVVVREGHEGKGIGGALVDKARDFFYLFNVESIFANVNPSDKVLMHLFETRKFKPVYMVMEKALTSGSPAEYKNLQESGVKYRKLKEQDLPHVQELVQELAKQFGETFSERRFIATAKNFYSGEKAAILLAEKEGKIIGVTFAETKTDPAGAPYGLISNVIIRKDARGSGIGTNLVRYAISYLSSLKVPKIWGNVNIGNEKMLGIYKKEGFQNKFTVMNLSTDVDTYWSEE